MKLLNKPLTAAHTVMISNKISGHSFYYCNRILPHSPSFLKWLGQKKKNHWITSYSSLGIFKSRFAFWTFRSHGPDINNNMFPLDLLYTCMETPDHLSELWSDCITSLHRITSKMDTMHTLLNYLTNWTYVWRQGHKSFQHKTDLENGVGGGKNESRGDQVNRCNISYAHT